MLPVVHVPIIFVFVTAMSYKHVILTLLNNPNSNLYYPIIGYFPIINYPHTQLVVTCPVQVGSLCSAHLLVSKQYLFLKIQLHCFFGGILKGYAVLAKRVTKII